MVQKNKQNVKRRKKKKEMRVYEGWHFCTEKKGLRLDEGCDFSKKKT
jgi:hypothetical protein